ncbi:MAG: acetylglutamate kinase [Chloroflexi bacterium]|nr:MAG: acetylglutamate kinase [Chloroflexota bacterium]PIE80894.1 MAG: acetylglutamate kinase [Chloroflexota bacterium]
MRVLKIGGNELNDPDFLPGLAGWVAEKTSSGQSITIVHGGGSDIAAIQSQLGLAPKKVDGLRVTDAHALTVAQMVLSGHVNKQIVTALLAAGVDAVGLSGVDGRLLTARKKAHPTVNLGLVGEIIDVRTVLLTNLSQNGITAVVSPISIGQDNLIYNVNADEAASAIAQALQADMLDFISNVPSVLKNGKTMPHLTAAQTETLINEGIINGGMVPKVRGALTAVAQGVSRARIVNLTGLLQSGGTIFSQQ